MSLTDLQAVARAMEALDMQVQFMEKRAHVNALQAPKPIHTGRVQNQGRSHKSNNATPSRTTVGDGKRCYCCDRIGHFAKDKVCPARNSTCRKCSKVGHFAKCCKTKHSSNQASTAAKKVYQIQDVNGRDDRRNAYAFSVDDVYNKQNSALVDLVIGGVEVKPVLIDSGASCNVMDKACTGEFTVINGNGQVLLGEETAEKMGVLRVGPITGHHVCSVTTEGSNGDIIGQYPEVFQGVGN